MANITKIKLPDGSYHNLSVKTQNIDGVIPFEKGGTNASTLTEAKINLGIEDIEEISNSEIEAIMAR